LGRFITPEKAARVYDKQASKLLGHDTLTNFPPALDGFVWSVAERITTDVVLDQLAAYSGVRGLQSGAHAKPGRSSSSGVT